MDASSPWHYHNWPSIVRMDHRTGITHSLALSISLIPSLSFCFGATYNILLESALDQSVILLMDCDFTWWNVPCPAQNQSQYCWEHMLLRSVTNTQRSDGQMTVTVDDDKHKSPEEWWSRGRNRRKTIDKRSPANANDDAWDCCYRFDRCDPNRSPIDEPRSHFWTHHHQIRPSGKMEHVNKRWRERKQHAKDKW